MNNWALLGALFTCFIFGFGIAVPLAWLVLKFLYNCS